MFESDDLTFEECCARVKQIDEIDAKIRTLQSQRQALMRNPVIAAFYKMRDNASPYEKEVLVRMLQTLGQ